MQRLPPNWCLLWQLSILSGQFWLLLYNYENIIPSLKSIVYDVFTGTAAAGGFLGGTIAFAFNRGVNRGLFSNEAGQGSAAIAHATARAHEPISEGLVALLGPLIDTIIICMLTGMVILSSGVWNKKYENQFQKADLIVLNGKYTENTREGKKELLNFITGKENLPLFTGQLNVIDGEIQDQNQTIIHARSIAENVKVWINGQPFSGEIEFDNGNLVNENIIITGKSLMHSAPLTTVAFTSSWLGDYGKYIVSVGLLLFAFSTAISWSYYGDRAVTFLWGSNKVIYYHIIYIIGFFLASFTDTTIIWTFSGITIALMTIPNLFGILVLHKEMKTETKLFMDEFYERFPNWKKRKS